MAAPTQIDAEELRLQKEAYLVLFENILKNRYTDPAAVQSNLAELRAFVDQRVSSPDAIFEFIPPLARKLALREEQLGTYIGQNFLKALSVAREKAKQQVSSKAGRAIPTDALAQDGPILEAILAAFGPFVQGPDHFEMLDNGGIKLVRKGREILPTSYSEGSEDAADYANVTGSDDAEATDDGYQNEADAPAVPSPGARAAVAAREERSILAEILDRFALDIRQKLVPQEFTEEGEDFVVEESAGSEADEAGQEPMLLDEILKRFGSVLNVQEKLVPAEYTGDGEEDDTLFDGGDGSSASEGDVWADTAVSFDPIPVVLTTFAAIRNKLAEFQRRQDRAGYQSYLADASDDIKATVAVLNLATRVQKQPGVSIEDELFRLSSTISYSADQLRELYGRIDRYTRGMGILNEFMSRVKQAPAPIQVEIRKVWKQVLDVLDEDAGESVARQRCRIILLAVNPAVKAQVESGIMSLISRMHA